MTPSEIAAIASAVSAVGSLFVAARMAVGHYKQVEHEGKSALYYIVTQVGGLVDYFQFFYKCHSTSKLEDVHYIVQQLRNMKKDIIDTDNPLFFNDRFSTELKSYICIFLEEYIGWRATKIIQPTEVFFEVEYINELQIKAIEVLKCIQLDYYEDCRFLKSIEVTTENMDNIFSECKKITRSMKFIGDNLYFLFSDNITMPLLRHKFKENVYGVNEIENVIVEKYFQMFLNETGNSIENSRIDSLLFYKEITRLTIDSKFGIYFLDSENTKYNIEEIVDHLYKILQNNYEIRTKVMEYKKMKKV